MIYSKLFGEDGPSADLLVLGETVFRGRSQRFGLLESDRLRHLWVLGKTGSGKSTLLLNLIRQDLQAGNGLAVLDPHGDLVKATLGLVPRHRINEVLLIDPADRDHPVALNVLRHGRRRHADPALLTSQLLSVFRKQWAGFWGPRLEHVLRNALLAVLELPEPSLPALYRFLTDPSYRDSGLPRLTDPIVRHFWTVEFPSYKAGLRAEALSPVLNKLGAFLANPTVRAIVGQQRSRVDFGNLIASRSIVLASLGVGSIGEDAGELLGGLILSLMQLAAMGRPRGGPPFYLYVDEFHRLANDALPTMLAESRKFGLGLVLAHQYLAQLAPSLCAAVLGNVGTSMVFRTGAADARALEPEFEPSLEASHLQALPPYWAAVRLLARGRTLDPFTARTLPPASGTTGFGDVVRSQSRMRFAANRAASDGAVNRGLGSPPTFSHVRPSKR